MSLSSPAPRPALRFDDDYALFGMQVAGLMEAHHEGRISTDALVRLIRELGYVDPEWRESWGLPDGP